MADITKRAGDCDGESGEGERGERGKRGHRGPPGPGGPATRLEGPTSGPGAVVADDDIPAGSVIATGGSMTLAHRALAAFCYVFPNAPACKSCLKYPGDTLPRCPTTTTVGVASATVAAGQIAQYVSAGPLTLDAATWNARTGGTSGLVPNSVYYLSASPGGLTTEFPDTGQVIKIGVALDAVTLDVGIVELFNTTDEFTIVGNGSAGSPFSAWGYGFGTEIISDVWELAPTGTLPGTPIFRNLSTGSDGQGPASAAQWLTAHVIGLSKVSSNGDFGFFETGGIFYLTTAQWNAVWTAADPNRGTGSGLIPGYPYYLSDVPGTFFLISTTGDSPVAPGHWTTRCFVALSNEYAVILPSPPQLNPDTTAAAELPVFPTVQTANFTALAGFVNQIDCSHSPRTVALPVAASVPNGTLVGIKKSNRADGQLVSLSTVLVTDTIDGAPGQGGGFLNGFLSQTGSSVLLVSDGISNWTILAGGNDNGF